MKNDSKIIRNPHKHNFVVLDRTFLKDQNLSLKAKGLMAYMLTNIDHWEFYASELQKHSKDGREAHSTALKELEEAGYLIKEQKREDGKFSGYDYRLFETPQERNCRKRENRKRENRKRENRNGKSVNGKTENGKPVTNEDRIETNINNNEYQYLKGNQKKDQNDFLKNEDQKEITKKVARKKVIKEAALFTTIFNSFEDFENAVDFEDKELINLRKLYNVVKSYSMSKSLTKNLSEWIYYANMFVLRNPKDYYINLGTKSQKNKNSSLESKLEAFYMDLASRGLWKEEYNQLLKTNPKRLLAILTAQQNG